MIKKTSENGIYCLDSIVDNSKGLKYIEFFFPKFPNDYCFKSLKIIINNIEYVMERPPVYFNKVEYCDKMENYPENCTYMISFSLYPLKNIERDYLLITDKTKICFVFEGLEENLLCHFTLHFMNKHKDIYY